MLLETIHDYVLNDINISDVTDEFRDYKNNTIYPVVNDVDEFIRVVKLKQGLTICDTEQLACMYAYTYSLMRCEGIFEVVRNLEPLKKIIRNLENTLIVDFGCGPATVALAFAYRYYRIKKREDTLKINYIGKDLTSEMIHLASNILGSSLFNNEKTIVTIKGQYTKNSIKKFRPNEIRINNLIRPDEILFVFSYIFSQSNIVDSVEFFIKDIKKVIRTNKSATKYHILYLNKDYQKDDGAYDIFIKKIKENGFSIHPDDGWRSGKPFMHKTRYVGKAIRNFDIDNISAISNMGPIYYQLLEIRRD